MRRKLLICLFACLSINCSAQTEEQSIPYTSILPNGATATFLYNNSEKVLKVNISNNENEVEVLATKHGTVVERESTDFMDDEILLNLSNNESGEYDIYIKTENELLYIGSVDTYIKQEDCK